MADDQGAGAAGTTAVTQKPGRAMKAVKFIIEFCTDQNNMTACPITKRHYRGRWDMSALKGRMPDDRFANCPDIPGHILIFDGAAKSVEVRDPMELRDNRETLLQAQKACVAMGWPKPEPNPPRVYKNLSDDKLKQFMYWARRWLDAKQVVVVEGQVPAMADVEFYPGRVERNVHDTSPKRERFPDEVPKYVTAAEAAGAAGEIGD